MFTINFLKKTAERRHVCIRLLLVLFFSATANHVWAVASAIAYGSDNSWGWATRATQQEASKAALKGCNETSPNKDCVLREAKAIVRAEGGGKIGFSNSLAGLAEARKLALSECGNKECKVVFETTKPGFFSLYKSDNDKNGNGNFYLTYQYDDSDEADKDAKEGCEKLTGQKCHIVWSAAIPGIYTVPSAPVQRPLPVASEKNCRPNSPTVRCSSQCTNGNCVVSYENGCKVRVQVQPRFDPFTNQWTYPAPSC
jgi:hypothetical protein